MTTPLDHDPANDLALVKDGAVVQVARAPCDPAWFGDSPDGELVDFAPNTVEAGMLWDSASLSDPPAPPPATPSVVSMRQAQLALYSAGRLDAVEAAVSAADKATQIWWATSRTIQRDNDVLKAVQADLGWSDAEVDGLFVAAAALP